MKEHKIAFIICVNNQQYFEECAWYLNFLNVPDGYETDVIAVREADSAAQGYSAGMESSDAKYKVYLHQDVFILNQNFIFDLLAVFQKDEKIGMAGLIGGVGLPKDAIIYNSWNCGRTISCNARQVINSTFYQKKPYVCVEAIDGMIMATQHDIPWRQDVLKEWDFYDISQSLEFRRAGYQVVIPYQENPWVFHDCGSSSLRRYDHNREITMKEYQDFNFGKYQDCPFSFPSELDQLTQQFKGMLISMLNEGKSEEAETLLLSFVDNDLDTELTIVRNIINIDQFEKKCCIKKRILRKSDSWEHYIKRYTAEKFMLRRIEKNMGGGGYIAARAEKMAEGNGNFVYRGHYGYPLLHKG